MGLGKTLTMLALIVQTLGEAAAFAHGYHRLPGVIRKRAKATLCVVPKTLIHSAWKTQIERHLHRRLNLKVCVFYGRDKQKPAAALKAELESADIVLTTYNTLVCDYRTKEKIINQYYWFRVVLDEAHIIRSGKSQTARACCTVEASRRWALTGTPIQNKLLDLGSLMTFLRAHPFDDPAEFRRTVVAPFERGDPTVFASLRILVDAVVLRRTKDALPGLPAKRERTLLIEMTGNDRRCYDKLVDDMSALVDAKSRSGARFRGEFLKGLMRIRRFCAHKQDLLAAQDLRLFRGLVAEHPVELDDDDDGGGGAATAAGGGDGRGALTRQVAMDMVRLTRESDCEECGACGGSLAVGDAFDADETPGAVYGHMVACYNILCPACFDAWEREARRAAAAPSAGVARCRLCSDSHGTDNVRILCADVVESLRNHEMLQANPRVTKLLGRYTGPSTKVQYLIAQLNVFREYNKAHPDKITKA
jgi:hypothetical protein